MAGLIRNAQLSEDSWRLLDAGAFLRVGESGLIPDFPPGADVLVPLRLWQCRRDELLQREGRVGVLVDGADEPQALADALPHAALIAIRIPVFTDGRAYSLARLLRSRFGYAGELRAVGDVLRDQLLYLQRCGFDAFALRADQDARRALAAFTELGAAVRRPYAWARAA
ncbi:MAG: DUF934 domain-containing protein [Betaproteobacteria bacterium]|nr:MAG: DUF934 domain-containing protein [Betaproteobacteria bacterium]